MMLIPKKSVRPMNFGWLVSPTAATAEGPISDTIIVSIMPARVTKKLSAMAGHATEIAFLVMYLRSF